MSHATLSGRRKGAMCTFSLLLQGAATMRGDSNERATDHPLGSVEDGALWRSRFRRFPAR